MQFNLGFISGFLSILKIFSIETLTLSFFLLSAFAVGSRIFQLLRFDVEPKLKYLFSFAIGSIFLSEVLFIFAKLSILTFYPVLFLLIFSFISNLNEIKLLLKTIAKNGIKLNELSPVDWALWSVLIFFIASNFIEVSYPVPMGFDDASLYLNLPNLLAQEGRFIHGFSSYPIALLQSIGNILFPGFALQKTMIFAFGLLSFFPLYYILRDFFQKKLSFLMIVIFYTIPFIFVHNLMQLKVEMPLFFFSTLSIFCFLRWVKEDLKKYLFLSALFLGFAISIKVTAGLLLIAFAAMFCKKLFGFAGLGFVLSIFASIYFSNAINFVGPDIKFPMYANGFRILAGIFFIISLIQTRKQFKNNLLIILIATFAGLLSLLPWFISNYDTSRSLSVASLSIDSQNEGPQTNAMPGSCVVESTGGTDADYEIYNVDYSNPILSFIFLPWKQTINIAHISIILDITFLFLAFLPVLFFSFPKDKNLKLLALGASVFWLIWAVAGHGVVWYGMAGFSFMILFLAYSINTLFAGAKYLKFSTIMLIAIFFFSAVFYRVNIYTSRTHVLMPYFANQSQGNYYYDYINPGYMEMASVLNADPEAKIYLTNDLFFKYFINNNQERVFTDHFLDTFACLYDEKKPQETLDWFKASGIKYFVISKPIDDPNYPKELYQIQLKLAHFALDNLKFIASSKDTYIFTTSF